MYTFKAHRISHEDNILFPDIVEIDIDRVLLTKGYVFGHRTNTIFKANIASVSLREGVFFADVCIETMGGATYWSEGFRKSDARRIVELLTR
jgi:hypothetical protein